jgi:hypothetical protein
MRQILGIQVLAYRPLAMLRLVDGEMPQAPQEPQEQALVRRQAQVRTLLLGMHCLHRILGIRPTRH